MSFGSFPVFNIGDKVVYPNHGVGVIEQIGSRTLGSAVERYYQLKFEASSLKVIVPCHNVSHVGLRRLAKNGEVQKVLDYLSNGKCATNHDWKDRFKENTDKMKAGTLMETAIVLKGLLRLHAEKPISFRERKMLDRAKYLLVSEMSEAKGQDAEEVEQCIIKALGKARLKFPDPLAEA